jgi:hypothetical protein
MNLSNRRNSDRQLGRTVPYAPRMLLNNIRLVGSVHLERHRLPAVWAITCDGAKESIDDAHFTC